MDEEKWKQFKTAIAAPQQEPRWVKDDKGWWNPDTKQVDPDDGSGDWYYLQETGDLEGACWHGTEKGSLEIWYVK